MLGRLNPISLITRVQMFYISILVENTITLEKKIFCAYFLEGSRKPRLARRQIFETYSNGKESHQSHISDENGKITIKGTEASRHFDLRI